MSTGDVAASLAWWERAEQDYATVGAAGDADQTRLSRLRALSELDDDPEVGRAVQAQLALLAAEHPDDEMARMLVVADQVARARERGDLPTARGLLADAVAGSSSRGRRPVPQLLASLEAASGLLALEDADEDGARAHLERAVAAALASRDVPAQAAVGEALARWYAGHGDLARAGRLLALAARFGARLHHLLGWADHGERLPPADPDAARAVEGLDGPAAVALLRGLLDRPLVDPDGSG